MLLPDPIGKSVYTRTVIRTIAFYFFVAASIHAGGRMVCGTFTAYAQSATATLSGTVYDENGSVIPNVNITVTNRSTSLKRKVATNDEGRFTVPQLPPATYAIRAERDGFASAEFNDVALNVNDQILLNIHLKVSSVGETVNITNGAPLIQESPEVATVIDRQFVENLPLNGRSFQSLIALTPGIVLTKSTFGEQGQFSVNGQRADANYFTIDGVSANIGVSAGFGLGQFAGGALPGLSAAGGTNNLVSIDALQEFKVLTSTYAPEFGRSPGGQVSIVTRSGTNKFHGSLFEYFRNDVLDANDWFANSLGLSRPPLRQNDFGGVLGGPIIRNKTFFFFSYEGLRLRQPLTVTTDVPSLSSRQSAPASIQPYLNAFPKPNGPATNSGEAAFSASYSDPLTLDATSIRLDHVVSDRLTLFGRYNYSPSESLQRGVPNHSLNTISSSRINTQTLTIGNTIVFNPVISNELKLNYSRHTGSSFYRLDDFGGAVVPPDSAFFPTPFSPEDAFFTFAIFNGRHSYFNAGRNVANLQRQFNIVNSLSLVARSHQLKVGIDYRRLSPIYQPRSYGQYLGFLGIAGESEAGSAGMALSGKVPYVQISANDSNTLSFNNLSAYVQDTWRIKDRLSLTYGMRWDLNSPPKGKRELVTLTGLDNPANLALAPLGTPLYKTIYRNFAPRIGLAYYLSRRSGRETVVRSGFGIFYDLASGSIGNSVLSVPYRRISTSVNLVDGFAFPLDPSLSAPPPFSLDQHIDEIYVLDPKLKTPLTYQWNFNIEQSIGANQTVSATYIGAAGRYLLQQQLLSDPNEKFTRVYVTRSAATSDYHSLQLQFKRRLTKGLQGLVSYAWSHSIDTDSVDSSFNNPPGEKLDPNLSRGSSDFDVRHSFNGAVTYNLPSPSALSIGSKILRSWSLDSIFTARTATPLNIIVGNAKIFGEISPRPDLVLGTPLYIDDPSVGGGKRINPDAFAVPQSVRQGTLGRNALRGFPAWQINLALRRQFNFTEKLNIQLRMEFFNLFNHPNFADPGAGVSRTNDLSNLSSFGRSASMLGRGLGTGGAGGGFSPLYQVGGPRSAQLALKLNF
jgi:carboxypeptidase family protein/TonB-dependent receptor-like protein